jgi:hypothetical protein
MKEPIEVLTEDGDVLLLYIAADRVLVCYEDGEVFSDVPLLPGHRSKYVQ